MRWALLGLAIAAPHVQRSQRARRRATGPFGSLVLDSAPICNDKASDPAATGHAAACAAAAACTSPHDGTLWQTPRAAHQQQQVQTLQLDVLQHVCSQRAELLVDNSVQPPAAASPCGTWAPGRAWQSTDQHAEQSVRRQTTQSSGRGASCARNASCATTLTWCSCWTSPTSRVALLWQARPAHALLSRLVSGLTCKWHALPARCLHAAQVG